MRNDGTGGGLMAGPRAPLALRRVALRVEYDGTDFLGFQRQAVGRTVQAVLEEAAATLGSDAPELRAAGRTDAGVHAEGQVVALSLPARLPASRVALSMNAVLPADVRVREAADCSDDFDPRRDAASRSYVYRLAIGVAANPLDRDRVATASFAFDPSLLGPATAIFRGEHEFRSWRAVQCEGPRTLLTISRADFLPADPFALPPRHHAEFLFTSRSFLQHQIRMMMGGILGCARGRFSLEALRDALARGDRPEGVVVADARGLSLVAVTYRPGRDPFPTGGGGA